MAGVLIDAQDLFLERRLAHEDPLQVVQPVIDRLTDFCFDEEAFELAIDCERLLADGFAIDEIRQFAYDYLEHFNKNVFDELTSTSVTIGI